MLDYDDLLLYWFHLLGDETLVTLLNERFDHILVDEYQDTNRLQSSILHRMRSLNRNLTVVGDDAQSIYSFRAAEVRNILDFPAEFPGADGGHARNQLSLHPADSRRHQSHHWPLPQAPCEGTALGERQWPKAGSHHL